MALYFFFATRVAVARGRYGVMLPATTGHPDFERVYRAHVNMLEWMPTFLIPLWLSAVYWNDAIAAALGLLWVIGRVWYFAGYSKAVEKRVPGFLVQATASILLFVGSIIGIAMHFPEG